VPGTLLKLSAIDTYSRVRLRCDAQRMVDDEPYTMHSIRSRLGLHIPLLRMDALARKAFSEYARNETTHRR
jgi:hypothetical protein